MSERTSKSKPKTAGRAGGKQSDDNRASAQGTAEEDIGRSDVPQQEEQEETVEEEELDGGEEAEDRSDTDVLIALGELDAEAALAYRIIAASIDDPAIRSKLLRLACHGPWILVSAGVVKGGGSRRRLSEVTGCRGRSGDTPMAPHRLRYPHCSTLPELRSRSRDNTGAGNYHRCN